jgi:signal transduction histidine kinase
MGRLINDHMLLVFFIYGLAFFLLGMAILLQRRSGSAFNIGNSLWLLAGFGLLHGLGEWMEMFLALGDIYWTPPGTEVIKIASLYFEAASFVCLLQFGLRIILRNHSKYEFLERTALIASLLFLTAVTSFGVSSGFSSPWLQLSQASMRYLVGFPGAILTAIGFWQQRKLSDIQGLSSNHVNRSLMAMAAVFTVYAFFAGLVVPGVSFFPASVLNYATFEDTVGIPIQLFRTVCALLAAYFISGILNIFNLESQNRLEKVNAELSQTNEQLETRVRERTSALTKVNEALREANEQLHMLSRRLFKVQEDERRHLARELHEQMGQELTAVKIDVQGAQHLEGRTAIVGRLDGSIAGLDRVLQQVRQLSLELRPSLLDDLGLLPALRWYLDQQGRLSGLRVEFFADPALERVDAAIETACFRVAQEALNNVVRHARAKTVTLELHLMEEVLHLEVRDDGIGFDVVTAQLAGFGLLGMGERVTLLGGELDCKSAPGHGTEVHASFPMPSGPHARSELLRKVTEEQ